MIQLPWLGPEQDLFPPVEQALTEPDGLLAAGGDLHPQRLVNAYAQGIFPWYEDGQPILWWSPDPRTVLAPAEVHLSRSLRKLLKKQPFAVTCDRAFARVIDACAAPRSRAGGTWITDDMRRAYLNLYRLGIAHSIEVWSESTLVGGLYGLALGRVFFGESMFSRASNTSKVAFATLCHNLERWGFALIDCQVESEHLLSLGARSMDRCEFTRRLDAHIGQSACSSWPEAGALHYPWGRQATTNPLE